MSVLTTSDEFQEWLELTLDKFPIPGPTVARRLVDLLVPADDSVASDGIAASDVRAA